MIFLIIFSLALHFAVLGALTVSMKTQDFELGNTSRSETLALEWGSSTSPSAPKQDPTRPLIKGASHPHVATDSATNSATHPGTSDMTSASSKAAAPSTAGGPASSTQTIGSAGPVTIGAGDPYYSEVRARIQSHATYTPALARRRLQGQVQVTLTLLSNGGIASLDITQSSGSSDLDRRALESVQAAAPFPTFQSQAGARKLELPIDFRLH
jgi:protein TonB